MCVGVCMHPTEHIQYPLTFRITPVQVGTLLGWIAYFFHFLNKKKKTNIFFFFLYTYQLKSIIFASSNYSVLDFFEFACTWSQIVL